MKKNGIALAALFTTAVLWGTGFVAIKYAILRMDTYWFISLRFTIAALVTALVFFRRFKTITKTDIKHGVILGLTLSAALTFQIVGCYYTTVGKNAFLSATYVVMIPFLHWIRTKKRPSLFSFIAAVICICGTAVISSGSAGGVNIGDMLSLLAGFFWGVTFELSSGFSQTSDTVNLQLVQLPCASVVTLVISTIMSPFPRHMNTGAALSLIYSAIFCIAIAFLLQLYGQRTVNSTLSGMILSMESVFAGIFSVILLGDSISLRLCIGGGLILLAVITGCLDSKEKHDRRFSH
ncbi:DMT family transporter [uncultured Ruminococcus sp.]|uniref:DMT family transporter n=1 Tax=uncultured Ruminococcus sp. TaxID=165186 RepID=UPI00260F154B|nr:DMT family transporter [uncultured Ruminococcus sp.]